MQAGVYVRDVGRLFRAFDRLQVGGVIHDDCPTFRVDAMPYGGTDCALPMLYALERGLEVDAFVIYTDSETWAGAIHPAQALRRGRG